MDDRRWEVGIRALRAGGRRDPAAGARAVPVCQTTSFAFEDSPDAADLFALRRYRNICSTAKAFPYTGAVLGIAARNLSQVV